MELYYRRSNGILETVVIYIPDLHSILPTTQEWKDVTQAYKLAIFGPEVEKKDKDVVKYSNKSSKKDETDKEEETTSAQVSSDDAKTPNKDKDKAEAMETEESGAVSGSGTTAAAEDPTTVQKEVAELMNAFSFAVSLYICKYKNSLFSSPH